MTNEKPACLLLVQRQFPPDETECHTDHCTSATLAEHGIPAHTHTDTDTQTYTHTYTNSDQHSTRRPPLVGSPTACVIQDLCNGVQILARHGA